jgi:hypothetical protein
MPASWKNRGTYGKLLRRVIIKQAERFEKCDNNEESIKIASNVGYLVDKLNNLLKQEESKIVQRIEYLEELAGITKRK